MHSGVLSRRHINFLQSTDDYAEYPDPEAMASKLEVLLTVQRLINSSKDVENIKNIVHARHASAYTSDPCLRVGTSNREKIHIW